MDANQMGNNVVNYIRQNGSELAAFAVITGGWTALAASGPKVVTAVCLAGGGLVATAIAFEVTRSTLQVTGTAIKGMFRGVRDALSKPTHTRPAGLREDMSGRAAAGM